MNRRTLWFLFRVAVLLAAVVGCAGTPAPPSSAGGTSTAAVATASTPTATLERVTFAYAAPVTTMENLPFDVAQALNLFTAEGLTVAPSYQPRINANKMLLEGGVDFASLGVDQTIAAQAEGKDLRMVVAFARFPVTTLVVRTDLQDKVKTVDDLKGQKINYGGVPGVWPYVAARAGMQAGDVQFVEDGRNIQQIAADLEKGTGVAAILVDPYTTQVVKSNKAYALVDLAAEAEAAKWLGGEYPNAGLVVTATTLTNRPETVQKMTNALVKALRYIATHSPAEIAAMLPASVTGPDKSIFAEALQHSAPIFTKNGTVNETGVRNGVEINKAIGAIKPDQQIDTGVLYTNDFVDEVQ